MTPNQPPSAMPENLPELPNVPKGFDRWEYRGTKWKSETPCLYAYWHSDFSRWTVFPEDIYCSSGSDGHYIEAVKDGPAKPRWVYHYAGRDSAGYSIDSLLEWSEPILTMDQYRRLKDKIVEDTEITRERFSLTSLSLLHQTGFQLGREG